MRFKKVRQESSGETSNQENAGGEKRKRRGRKISFEKTKPQRKSRKTTHQPPQKKAVSRRQNSGTFRMPLTVKLKAPRATVGEAWSWNRRRRLNSIALTFGHTNSALVRRSIRRDHRQRENRPSRGAYCWADAAAARRHSASAHPGSATCLLRSHRILDHCQRPRCRR